MKINPRICSLGVFGTNYIRNDHVDLDNLSVEEYQQLEIVLPHVVSERVIGTELQINMRLS